MHVITNAYSQYIAMHRLYMKLNACDGSYVHELTVIQMTVSTVVSYLHIAYSYNHMYVRQNAIILYT